MFRARSELPSSQTLEPDPAGETWAIMALLQALGDRIECMRVRPLLQGYLDGALTASERDRVAAHLEACRRCGLAASTYRNLKTQLRRLADPPDAEAVGRLEEFIDELERRDDFPDSAPGAG
jgi:hypothetical protein